MFQYVAYGMTIRSTLELPELPAADEAVDPDVEIRTGTLEPVPESVPGEGTRRIVADPDCCRLTYDTIGTFLVEAGERVTVDPDRDDVAPGEVPPKVVRRLFENEMMGILLHQRGALVLHASAVAVDGRAAVFLGPRGAGKSTTAAAFHTRGHTTLEDDVVGIDVSGDRPVVLPGVPQLRLKPEAIDALGVDGTTRPERDTGAVKRYKQLEPTIDPVPLSTCYLLADGNGDGDGGSDGDDLALEPIDPQTRVVELISRTYTGGMLRETDATAINLEQCARVADVASFRRLRRPKTHDSLPAVVDCVARDLRSSKPRVDSLADPS